MEPKIAQAVVNAQAVHEHPLLDFRTPEARAKTDWMVEHLAPLIVPGRRLLDIGCSSGKHTFRAHEIGLKATGIDCAEAMLTRARRLASETGTDVGFVSGDYTNMPFEDAYFDYALFPKNIVECSYFEYQSLVHEIARILKKTGTLFVTMTDGLDKIVSQGKNPNYDRMTGCYPSTITIPSIGTFDYPTSFWTVGFARFITERAFEYVGSRLIDDRPTYLLLFSPRS